MQDYILELVNFTVQSILPRLTLCWKGFVMDWITQPHIILLLNISSFLEVQPIIYLLIIWKGLIPGEGFVCLQCFPVSSPTFLYPSLPFRFILFLFCSPSAFPAVSSFPTILLPPSCLLPTSYFPRPSSSSSVVPSSFMPFPWNMTTNYYVLDYPLKLLSWQMKGW